MKRIVASVIFIVLLLSCLVACSNDQVLSNQEVGIQETKEEYFEEIVDIVKELEEKRLGSGEKYDRATNLLRLLNTEFVREYLKTHSTKETLEKLFDLQRYMNSVKHYMHDTLSLDCFCKNYSRLVNAIVAESEEIQIVNFDRNQTIGYYSENINAEPQEGYINTISGSFYNRSGQNEITENRNTTQTVEYFGDFAIATKKGFIYHEGRYAWVDGVFYDELPSWESYTEHSIWYKGKIIGNGLSVWHDMDSDFVDYSFAICQGEIEKKQYYLVKDVVHKGEHNEIDYYHICYNNITSEEAAKAKWVDIDMILAAYANMYGLKSDGTVITAGGNDYGQREVSDWYDITAIAAGYEHTVGLKSDGTVVAVGYNINGECDVGDWSDIVALSANSFYGSSHTVGLKSDGTVIAMGNNDHGQCEVSDWHEVTAIAAGYEHTVGLKSDGTVVAVGRDCLESFYDVSHWSDIIAISAASRHTVGLRRDGKVVAVGRNNRGQCDVNAWTDIIAISANDEYTVGLKSDGTVVIAGAMNFE